MAAANKDSVTKNYHRQIFKYVYRYPVDISRSAGNYWPSVNFPLTNSHSYLKSLVSPEGLDCIRCYYLLIYQCNV